MYRQSPSRNQRSKGIKVKNVLQICLLLAVCFWLIYQVKHSHDKKKEFDETDAKTSLQKTSSDELVKLGRKDIRGRVDETDSKNEIQDEPSEEEETIGEEVDEHKHDEDEQDKKVEEREDDEAGGRDDETEEHEQEKSDAEIDREQGLVDGEEREDGEENETHETDSEDGHGQMEKESTVDDTDHDADDRSAHEAREEHYKADDASSAVTHDAQIVTENENEHVENSDERPGNILEEEKKENNSEETFESENRKYLEVEGSEAARDGHQSNDTTSAAEEDMSHNSENGSTPNDAVTEGSNDHLMRNSTTDVTIENNDLPSDNSTESKPELGHDQGNATEGTSTEGSDVPTVDPEQASNSILNVGTTHLDSNSTGSGKTIDAGSQFEEFSDSSNNSTDSSASENSSLEASNEEGNTTESSPEKNNELDGEKSDTSDGTDESLESTSTDNPEEFQEDTIDISDTSNGMLEKDVRTDLDTLPEIQTEGSNSEDVAAE
ncbi:myb-like protein X [Perilla frutescens var. hirtella]|nr:myb-like protein X [Perilla frutescens var. hirtella]